MKVFVQAVYLAAAAMLFLAHPAMSAPGGDSGCASASVSVVTGTDTVAPGTVIAVGGSINNCSVHKTRYKVAIYAVSSCGQKTSVASSRLAFDPGESRMFSASCQVPSNTCDGPWVATVEVSDNGGMLASASTTVTIQ
jgi:hypothetical protein